LWRDEAVLDLRFKRGLNSRQIPAMAAQTERNALAIPGDLKEQTVGNTGKLFEKRFARMWSLTSASSS
jgi:hypothetical protein